MLDAERYRTTEDRAHIVRTRARGKIPVTAGMSKQPVTHGAADRPHVVAGSIQLLRDIENCGWRMQLHVSCQPQRTDPPFTLRISPVM
jgi:hypothetical protein